MKKKIYGRSSRSKTKIVLWISGLVVVIGLTMSQSNFSLSSSNLSPGEKNTFKISFSDLFARAGVVDMHAMFILSRSLLFKDEQYFVILDKSELSDGKPIRSKRPFFPEDHRDKVFPFAGESNLTIATFSSKKKAASYARRLKHPVVYNAQNTACRLYGYVRNYYEPTWSGEISKGREKTRNIMSVCF